MNAGVSARYDLKITMRAGLTKEEWKARKTAQPPSMDTG